MSSSHRRRSPDLRLLGALGLVALGLGPTTPAHASDFWATAARTAAEVSYDTTMAAGDELALEAAVVFREEPARARSLALKAVARYEAAIDLRADAAEPHFRAAELLYRYYVEGQQDHHAIPEPTARALAHWAEAERLAPRDPRLATMYFERSLAHTQLGGRDNYRLGIADYEAELALSAGGSDEGQLDTVVANEAELHMAIGEIDDALTLYRRALELNPNALYGYGLAIALDRDGQGAKARELLADYAHGAPFEPLDRDSVFFVPEGDEFYYRALMQEVLGKYDSAANYFQRYLTAQPDSPWAARAREDLAAVKKKLGKTSAHRAKDELEF